MHREGYLAGDRIDTYTHAGLYIMCVRSAERKIDDGECGWLALADYLEQHTERATYTYIYTTTMRAVDGMMVGELQHCANWFLGTRK